MTAPCWDRLYEVASSQDGYFTTAQAADVGYSPQLLVHYLRTNKLTRLQRGIYRLVHFPPGEHEELTLAWLWSEQQGVISHQTALSLLELSDVLPSKVHVTLPLAWKTRRLRVPSGVEIHHGNVPKNERTWFGPVPITKARRSLFDSAREGLSPEFVKQATRQALKRGLVTKQELRGLSEVSP